MNQARIRHDLDKLAVIDADLRRGLELVSYPKPRIRGEGFETLVSTIVSQQISTEAAAAIMARLRQLLPRVDADAVLTLAPGALRDAGLSARKAEYVEGLARAIASGRFEPAALAQMDDRTAIDTITSLRGFGVWSAEIYLMFSLQRRDVFAAGDLALRIALQKLKRLETAPGEKQARALVAPWSPYRSAGSLFLWHYYRGAPA